MKTFECQLATKSSKLQKEIAAYAFTPKAPVCSLFGGALNLGAGGTGRCRSTVTVVVGFPGLLAGEDSFFDPGLVTRLENSDIRIGLGYAMRTPFGSHVRGRDDPEGVFQVDFRQAPIRPSDGHAVFASRQAPHRGPEIRQCRTVPEACRLPCGSAEAL